MRASRYDAALRVEKKFRVPPHTRSILPISLRSYASLAACYSFRLRHNRFDRWCWALVSIFSSNFSHNTSCGTARGNPPPTPIIEMRMQLNSDSITNDFCVEVNLIGAELDPERVTSITGMQPVKAARAGDARTMGRED